MSNNYGPRIVTDGLVSCFDAADRNSYPGTGTTWYDISGNDNHATSVSWASSYLSNNGGVINYPAQNNTLTTSKTASQIGLSDNDGITMSVFLNKKSNPPASNLQGMIGFPTLRIWNTTYFYVAFRGTNETEYSPNWSNATEAALRDQWIELCFTWQYNVLKFYFNGQLIKTQTLNVYLKSIQSDYFRIGAGMGYYNFYGSISNIKLYNRVLMSSEVLQNHNATKGRFGL